jgi:hypothetical protein
MDADCNAWNDGDVAGANSPGAVAESASSTTDPDVQASQYQSNSGGEGNKMVIRLCNGRCEDGPARMAMSLTSQRRGVRPTDARVRKPLLIRAIEQVRRDDP